MLILPQNVEWKTVFYNNPSADLIATDLQKLKSENTIENLKSESKIIINVPSRRNYFIESIVPHVKSEVVKQN